MRPKLLLLAAALLPLLRGQAQPLHGGFTTDHGKAKFWLHSYFFWFNNGRFVYSSDGTGARYGGGTFRQAGDSLLLQFDTWTKPPLPIRIDSIAPTADQPAGIQVRVLDVNTQEGLPGTTVRSTTHPGANTATNVEGQAHLSYTPTAGDSIRVCYLSYEEVTFATIPGDHRQYTVSLRPTSDRMRSGTRWAYLVKSSTSAGLLIQRVYPFVSGWTDRYRRLSGRKTRRVLRWYRRCLRYDRGPAVGAGAR